MAVAAGTRRGPYETVALIGAGGMGEVYRARDTSIGRGLAVAILPARLAANLDIRTRPERDANAAAALIHSEVLALSNVGCAEERTFTTEALKGGSG